MLFVTVVLNGASSPVLFGLVPELTLRLTFLLLVLIIRILCRNWSAFPRVLIESAMVPILPGINIFNLTVDAVALLVSVAWH
jgi:hypothetical protein